VHAEKTIVVGDTKPGRHTVGYWSDTHFGCRHSDLRGMKEHRQRCWDLGAKVMVHTGDLLDGNRPVLLGDQDRVGFDSQLQELLDVVIAGPPLIDVAIDGNHDGYYSSAIGTASGRLVASAMKDAGRDWRFAGVCEGRACIHGADWYLWHPAGGSTDKLGVLKVLRDKADNQAEHIDVLACGHLHKFSSANLVDTLLVCSGTFQRKMSEFGNRISGPWDIGGAVVSYCVDKRGAVTDRSAQWYPSRPG
jgi:predicted phosphodiesterase